MQFSTRVFLLLIVFLINTPAQDLSHPLDPLSKGEIAAATKILKESGRLPAGVRFQTIVLREPPKAEVLGFKSGDKFRREAFFIGYDRAGNKTYEAVVDIGGGRVISAREIPGAQPSLMLDDVLMFQSIVRSDPQWQEAMRKRGITEFGRIQIEMWSAGYFGFPEEEGKGFSRPVVFSR
ncbi:MAG: hypothetical protein IPO77_11920 [Acidobacteria bacterium]|nr:hypothetical protein [Acidobacteriota bacterium]